MSTHTQQTDRIGLHTYPGPDALADAAASHMINHLTASPPTRERWCVALSGGRIAPLLFESVVAKSKSRAVSWEKTEFFFADERWVPWDDNESNYGVARRHLFDPLQINPKSVHPVYLGRSPEFDAAQAQADLLRRTPVNVNGDPILDLVILGMGEDGHIASLFPNASEDVVRSRAVYLPVKSPKPPPQRITLTYSVLAAALHVLVVVSGPGKEPALRDSLSTHHSTPLGRLIALRQHTVLLTDFRFEVKTWH
ncbi:MAG: 6-phosphogluconolactonase [Verrucomicrobiota bacterium]|nr:6-phosphogluconolactonase [Verrucomicrobiota bacterium]